MLQLLSHPPATDVRSVRSSPSTCTRSAHQKPVVFRLGQDDFGLSPPTAAQRMFCRKLVAGFVVEPPPSMINLRKRIERRRKKNPTEYEAEKNGSEIWRVRCCSTEELRLWLIVHGKLDFW
uniref:(northern house mosquito) hypothetical protein n=1 Tax=Culex pipiens TaxID=7175 RepID=A0A8D8G4N1_CULPI